MKIDVRAGQLAAASDLVDVPKLLTAYYEDRPDPHIPAQRVVFGTSGHRGSSFDRAFKSGDLGFADEESAGSSFLRRDSTVWTTDKDGIIAALLAAEITAKTKKDPVLTCN